MNYYLFPSHDREEAFGHVCIYPQGADIPQATACTNTNCAGGSQGGDDGGGPIAYARKTSSNSYFKQEIKGC